LETIASSTEISRLFSEGKRAGTPFVTLITQEREPSVQTPCTEHDREGRVAFIAGKKLGNAVWRNRAKRRMLALCRETGGPWPGYDVIFLAKPAVTQASYSKVLSACRTALARCFHEE